MKDALYSVNLAELTIWFQNSRLHEHAHGAGAARWLCKASEPLRRGASPREEEGTYPHTPFH